MSDAKHRSKYAQKFEYRKNLARKQGQAGFGMDWDIEHHGAKVEPVRTTKKVPRPLCLYIEVEE